MGVVMTEMLVKEQKVIRVGNSLAVTLDSGFVAQAGISPGSLVATSYLVGSKLMRIKAGTVHKRDEAVRLSSQEKRAVLSAKITPELKDWTDKFLKDNQKALKALADL